MRRLRNTAPRHAAPDYTEAASAAARTLVSSAWFDPGAWVPQDFWRTPNIMTALDALMSLTQTNEYAGILNAGFDAYQTVFQPAYYDDEAWWGAAFLRIHARTGEARWLDAARSLFDDLAGGWDDVVGGGVWFKRDPKSYDGNDKNAISTALYFEIAARLAALDGSEPRYLDAAKSAWAWMQRLVDRHGLVWGNLLVDASVNQSNPPRPYIQGVMLGALASLYDVTKDEALIDSAIAIADVSVASMAWPGGVARDIGEVLGDFRPTLLDPILFKPIFTRYLGEFAVRLAGMPKRATDARRYAAYLALNAGALLANYPQGVYGMDWHLAQPDYAPASAGTWGDFTANVYNGTLQSAAIDVFVAAARTTG